MDSINYLFDNYAKAKNEPFEKHPNANYIRNTIPNNILSSGLIDQSICKVDASPGKYGRWANVPWIRIYRTSVSKSAQEGVYIVYLFSADGDTVFLTLNQGCTDVEKNTTQPENSTKKSAIVYSLRRYAEHCTSILNEHSFNSGTISLGKKPGDRGMKYEQGTIFYKEYKKQGIPSEEVLEKDLKDMLEIYEEYYNKIFLKEQQTGTSQKASPFSKIPHEDTMQKIFFGAPGTGKSYKIDYDLFKDEKGTPIGIKEIPINRKFRTTFHPDYDYAQFVGAYKPKNISVESKSLSIEQLPAAIETLQNEIHAPTKFGAEYHDSLKLLTPDQRKELALKLAGRENASDEISVGISVGDYLNKELKNNTITYTFVPQVFAKAYAAAWKQYFDAGSVSTVENQVYLVIEEINRGNCAQIFGDIFQLLDRVSDGSDKGFSQYSIDADCDFADWLKNNDAGLKSVWNQYKDEVGDGKLRLPPNLNILATMNTSDQSLFPMDSAFKRRFDWEYVPISFEGKDAANYQIDIDGSKYSWQNFVEAVNDKILDLTESEDKQLGEFFIKPDSGNVISKERFLGKVMFYLWNEVCKDEHKNGSFFRAKINDNKDFFTFQDLYKKKDLLKLFMDELLKKE